jgi:hypothetical protein
MARTIDPQTIIGKKFHRLEVIAFAGRRERGRMWFTCRCQCGSERDYPYQHLRKSATKSCGCHSREMVVRRNTTHGKSKTPEYRTWKGMISRCYNKNNKSYKHYGGRGITVCREWRRSFLAFLKSVGPVPKDGGYWMIERIRNDEGYKPDNCKWAKYKEQARNRRNNKIVEFEGKTWVFVALCEHFGISRSAVENRLRYGWTLEHALKVPVKSVHRYSEVTK